MGLPFLLSREKEAKVMGRWVEQIQQIMEDLLESVKDMTEAGVNTSKITTKRNVPTETKEIFHSQT